MGSYVPVHRSEPVHRHRSRKCRSIETSLKSMNTPHKLAGEERNVLLLLPRYQHFCQDDELVPAF